TPSRVVFNDPDPADPGSLSDVPRGGRHLNGKLCFFPKRGGHRGQYLLADDAYREACLDVTTPQARCAVTRRKSPYFLGKDPDGWAVFNRKGMWTRLHIDVPWDYPNSPQPQGTIDPQGCCSMRRDVSSGTTWDTARRARPTAACSYSSPGGTSATRPIA